MAEQTFRSPGFFPRETEIITKKTGPSGPAVGVIGTAEKGPAFVPVLINTFQEFVETFGEVDGDRFGPLAVRELLENGGRCVFVRVLGAGANTQSEHFNNTRDKGIVNYAGFKLSPSALSNVSNVTVSAGAAYFLVASHSQHPQATSDYPLLGESCNIPIDTGLKVEDQGLGYVRAMIFAANDTNIFVSEIDADEDSGVSGQNASYANAGTSNEFMLYVSSSVGVEFANDDNSPGVRAFTASLNPSSINFVDKILNKDMSLLGSLKHCLYASFDVDDEVGQVENMPVAIVSGTSDTGTIDTSRDFLNKFGSFDTRYQRAKSPYVISQPYGSKEYNLFRVEALADGADINDKYKITIANLKKSNSLISDFGTFALLVRDFYDTDESPIVLESYYGLNLDPASDNFVGRRIGDRKVFYDLDQPDANERRLVTEGKYENISRSIRVVLSDDLESGNVPNAALPFGFRGYELLKTIQDASGDSFPSLRGDDDVGGAFSEGQSRLVASGTINNNPAGFILPPIPMRRKLTKNVIGGNKERVDSKLCWGVQFTRVSGSASEPNKSSKFNNLIKSYTKFLGISRLDVLVTGSAADKFNNNKFTLDNISTAVTNVNMLQTGSINDKVVNFIHYRTGSIDTQRVPAGGTLDLSLADVYTEPPDSNGLVNVVFNRFSAYTKFSFFLHGGFDGVDLTNNANSKLNDKASSTRTGGSANSSFTNAALGNNSIGVDLENGAIQSYRRAIDILSNPSTTDINLLVVPGIRESLVTDYASDAMRDRFDAFFIMDIENFSLESDGSINRLFDGSSKKPDIKTTIDKFLENDFDNNFAAAYFSDVVLNLNSGRRVTVPPSVAVLNAFMYNDRVGQPWFAPAGFNRGGLPNVNDVNVRLNFNDRDALYDASINPIASFPREGIVIFGQKTLQAKQTALDRVNVRRLLIEVRRAIRNVANSLLFEQNNAATRARFSGLVVPILERIQIQAGLERFKVVIDDTTTTQEDIDNNTLKGQVFIVPTKVAEFIAVDFIITDAGVQF